MFFKDKEEYLKYLDKNKVDSETIDYRNCFEWSEEGKILLDQSKCCKSMIDIGRYTNCLKWIMLQDNKTMALLKFPFGDIYRSLNIQDYYISMYNNILLPEVAIQLQNNSAKYYLAKMKTNSRQAKDIRTYILTIDFKDKEEELIYGENILEDMGNNISELNIEKIIMGIEDYLIEKGYNYQDIETIKREFIKQSFFNRFTKQIDENNHNWGILVDSKTKKSRITPIYDLDCSCEVNKNPKHIRRTNDGSMTSLKSFLNQYKEESWFKSYIEEIINSFDIEKAFADSEDETNIKIPSEYETRYRKFFNERYKQLNEAYKDIYINDKVREDDER